VKTLSKSLIFGFTLILFALSGWLIVNLQSVADWWKLRSYVPSAQIAKLSIDSSFSTEGQKLFYVHDPALLPKADFKGKCTVGEQTIVLGCYISNDKIYVFDVDDVRLDGVEQVTAAHEMLHAVYDRMSAKEKSSLDAELVAFYETLDNERLRKTIDNYRSRDPSVVPNELHSILGTEVSKLPQSLEQHYAKYFLDRQTVVKLSEAYEAEFARRQDQIETYDSQLKDLSASIDSQENQIELLGVALADEQKNLQSLKGNPQAYNAAVPGFNRKVSDYNSQLENLKIDIKNYNSIVEDRNAIASEEQDLVNAIDTRTIELE
jgi:predicted  nucleic acid-binding Zn-ribbon protein